MKGFNVCDRPVSKAFLHSNNGAFITLKDGQILFAYVHTTVNTSFEDNAIYAISSHDSGQTWSQSRIMINNSFDKRTCMMSPSFMRLLDGRLALFFTLYRNANDCALNMSVSSDEGLTWSVPRPCVPYKGYFVTNNDRIIRLSNGRLLFGASSHDPDTVMKIYPDADSNSSIRREAITFFFFSDDDGQTWHPARNAVSLNVSHSTTGLQEPGAIELYPGILWGYGRTDLGRHYEFFSFDNGNSWTQPEASYFTAPCSPLAIKRNPLDRSLLAVWNPVPAYISQERDYPSSGRFRLVYSVSMDNGAHWQSPQILENDVHGEFSHPAIHFCEHHVLIAYDAMDIQLEHHFVERIRLIPYESL